MNTDKYIWLLLLLCFTKMAVGQNYVLSNDIPVSANGRLLKAAWAGGLTAPQLSAVDLNNDGRLDLVVFDRDGNWLLPFLNGGAAGLIDYSFQPNFRAQFPTALHDWMLMRDFDADGYMDIFTAVPQVSNVRVFRNTSTFTGGTLSFSLFKDTVYSTYPPRLPIYSGRSDVPAIDDIDGDGDLDFLTFQLGGTKVEWHKNLSIENTGGLGQMEFLLQSRCFGHFEEDQFGCAALIGRVPCGAGQKDSYDWSLPERPALHAGSTILSLDLDNNGLKDLLIGDIGCPTIYSLTNGGTSQIADFTGYDPDYPSNDSSAYVLLFPATFHLDIDNDGLQDLLVAPNKSDLVEDRLSIQYYHNAGSSSVPDFKFQRYGILQDEMIDNGTASMPTFLDYNGDGLKDLLIGGAGRYDSVVSYHPRLALYANVGTAQQPAYNLVSDDYLGLSRNPAFSNANFLHPTAADLDGDGDDDLLLGNVDGAIFYFVNVGGAGNPANFSLVTANFANIDVGTNSSPQLVDLDADADFDLLIGNFVGYIHYYRNVGTTLVPSFVLVTDTFGGIKVNNFSGQIGSNGYAQPFAVDLEQDGDLDLLVGAIDGEIQVYKNISLAPNAVFSRDSNLFGMDFGYQVSVAAAVLDSARLTYLVGDHRGGLMLWREGGPLAAPSGSQAASGIRSRVYPNPSNSTATIEFLGNEVQLSHQIDVFDITGRRVASWNTTSSSIQFDTQSYEAGIYTLKISSKRGVWSERLVVTH